MTMRKTKKRGFRSPSQRKAIFARFARMYKKGLKRTKVESSNIHSVGYEPVTKVLEVRFRRKKGTGTSLYRYAGVESKMYKKMMQAKSHGKFFHKNIRSKYPYQRVT